MKKPIVIIAILVFSLNIYCQDYIPLVDTNSVWNVTWNCYPPPPYPCYMEYYRYQIFDDTLYNDTLYKKLFKVDMNKYCSSIIIDSSFEGGIREEVENKKVYYNKMDGWGEKLLYDFTLEVGDTVPWTYNNFWGYPELYVSSIDYIQCTDGLRKRFIYSRPTWFDIEVIEGIGAYTGLLEEMRIFEYISTMRCFYNSDTMIYMNPYENSCNLEMDTCVTTDILKHETPSETIRVYPIPTSTYTSVEIINPRGKYVDYKLTITDALGILKHESSFQDRYIIIDSKKHGAGMYFYLVHFKNQRIASGVLIIK